MSAHFTGMGEFTLVKEMMMQIIQGLTVYENCPLCGYEYGPEGGLKWKLIAEPRLNAVICPDGDLENPIATGFTYCPQCGFVHQLAYMPDDQMKIIYSGPMYKHIIEGGVPKRADRSMRSSAYNEAWRAYELCKVGNLNGGTLPHYVKDANSILDVGCSKLLLLQSMDFYYGADHSDGVDPAPRSKQIGQVLGFEIWDHVDKIPNGRKYDLITCIHTFEHISDPHRFLKTLRDHLNSDGRLFIVVPNLYSLPALNFFHITSFTTKTLPWMLETCGFEVETIKTEVAHWMRWYPQDLLCVAKISDQYRVDGYKPDQFMKLKKNIWTIVWDWFTKLPIWIVEPRPPKLIVPVYIAKKEEFGEMFKND